MKLIISPAKKNEPTGGRAGDFRHAPFMEQTGQILQYMRGLTRGEAQKLWKCNDSIADLNYKLLFAYGLKQPPDAGHPLLRGYPVPIYGPQRFQSGELYYIQNHLRILSGFYGILRPLDGIVPYRLEMAGQDRSGAGGRHFTDLYSFWVNGSTGAGS